MNKIADIKLLKNVQGLRGWVIEIWFENNNKKLGLTEECSPNDTDMLRILRKLINKHLERTYDH